ncbi:uncharacterized protein LOC132754317 [Ruditapes philippinarum]|uniref:uncharacterized protein LOC132754317 n=1 Tax=Ruditapes philippinarum TaxID=129788 RepID=UPI00295BCA1A|nr:uncharacterized protein LOC132754317 [Ruditapes philippinarum]
MAEQFAIEMFKYIKSLEDFLSRKTENGEVITHDECSKMCTYKNTIEYISNIHNFMKDHAQQQVTEDQMASLNNKQKDLIRTDELEKINDLGLKSLQQVPDVQQNLRQQSNKTKAKKTYNQVKNEVQKSYSKDRNLAGEVTLELENTDSCFKTLKTLDRHTQSAGRTKLFYNIQKGEVLKKIKDFEKGGFLNKIIENGMPYKISHCNFLIKLYKFSLNHSNIIHCSLSLHFLQKHWSVIPRIFDELKW